MVDRPRLTSARAPRALLLLVAIHALSSWLLWLDRFEDLSQKSITVGVAITGLLGTWGLLLVWLAVVLTLWTLWKTTVVGERAWMKRPRGSFLLRAGEHVLLWVGLLALAMIVDLFAPNVRLMMWLFFALWLLGFGATGVSMLVADGIQPQAEWIARERRFATSDALAPTAALAWSMFVAFELLFHYYAANFVLFEDITMFLTVMQDEAINMMFGPNAPWFATALLLYALIASVACMVLNRRARSKPTDWLSGRSLAAVAIPGVIGLMALWSLPIQDTRLILHHIHPQSDDLAGLLIPLRPPGEQARAAAQNLYPEVLANKNEELAPTSMSRETLAEYGARSVRAPARHKHAIVIFIDTLSRRNLEAWGYERPVAPHLSSLAKRSTRYDRARSNGGTTDLATVALFYGLRPLFGETKTETYLHGHGGLPVHLLARAAGIQVGMFSGDWEVWEQGNSPLFPTRCDHFLDARLAQESRPDEVRLWSGLREDLVVDELIKWLTLQDRSDERSLAYLKFLRPHIPYYTPPSLPDGWSPPFLPQSEGFNVTDLNPEPDRQVLTRNRYDNSVNFVDHQLGRLIAYLEKSDRLKDTAIILVADHGEAWGQHGWYTHGYQNYEEFLEVPLLVYQPGATPSVDRRPVTLLDIAPTVLDLLGLPAYDNHQGVSLLQERAQPVFWADSNSASRMTTIEIDSWKYTENLLTAEASLYNLADDPDERRNLAYTTEHAERRAALRFLLYEGNALQLSWARELRSVSTASLLGPEPEPE